MFKMVFIGSDELLVGVLAVFPPLMTRPLAVSSDIAVTEPAIFFRSFHILNQSPEIDSIPLTRYHLHLSLWKVSL